jgi:nucleotide-binding universal stress UspA family protein
VFTKILVPLDGSDLAERALQPAIDMARCFSAGLVLLRVVTTQLVGMSTFGPSEHLYHLSNAVTGHDAALASEYLQGVRRQRALAGISVDTAVLEGVPAETIIAVAYDKRADLILMSTHGRTGLRRLIYGSVADAVLRASSVPVMLIPIRDVQE